MEIQQAARRHGVHDDDIRHAFEHPIAWIRVGDDPQMYLLAGPDAVGNLLVVLVVLVAETAVLVTHAMTLRTSTAAAIFGAHS